LKRRSGRIVFFVLLVLVVLLVAAKLHYAGRAPVKLPASACNAGLWTHVYQPERLKVVEPCTAAEGRITSVFPSTDGDLHIGLDPEQKSVLNLINATHAHRRLIVEAVCDHPASGKEAAAACAGFISPVKAPKVGEHVRVIGTFVIDSDNGWTEIHPVTRIEVLH
jgi:hypothetical protein